ncbi:type II toxin-antitoxin system VapC family toxin [Candidatus Bathyarchaeota archaeon]|nr:type II toxin-antitoxin system VapC family toxin [Candidatus Bathyarchaeota archaeon]
MRGPIVYLDSSSMVKRYVEEPGTRIVREAYLKAYSGELLIAFSLWNIGEVLGALDRALMRDLLSHEAYTIVKRRLLLETRRLLRLGVLIPVSVRFKLLTESWNLVEKHHIYVADALQIVSARAVNAAQFFTGDRKLHEVASIEGLKSTLTL